MSFFLINYVLELHGQSDEWIKYNEYRKIADSAYDSNNYEKCWKYLLLAYNQENKFVYYTDNYTICQCFALDNQLDSAYKYLNKLNNYKGLNCEEIKNDTCFKNIKNTVKWTNLIEKLNCITDTVLYKELQKMLTEDQLQRKNLKYYRSIYGVNVSQETRDSVMKRVEYVDSVNTLHLEKIIDEFGWPGFSLVGPKGSFAAWMIVQHSDTAFMSKCLPLLYSAIQNEEAFAPHYAYLLDRILISRNQDQLYGTQLTIDGTVWQISDIDNLNQRRELMKLEPLNIDDLKSKLKSNK